MNRLAQLAIIGGAGLAGALAIALGQRSASRQLGSSPRARRARGFRQLGKAVTTCAARPKHAVSVCVTRPEKPGAQMKERADVCRLLRSAADKDRESLFSVLLDAQNRVVGVEEVHRGTLSYVDLHPREVMKSAILTNAAGLIIAHNHPSGIPEPSDADRTFSARIKEAGETVGIPVLDSLIITPRGCSSVESDD